MATFNLGMKLEFLLLPDQWIYILWHIKVISDRSLLKQKYAKQTHLVLFISTSSDIICVCARQRGKEITGCLSKLNV